ncbi:MAG TPA: hypothetical protein ENN80_03080 [Candidatus Hydrogenedentes bacterium]|nr:hypothetical protein [Candidatus Hydrogenedentota bacterium]
MGELCEVVQEITLRKGIKRVDFRTILVDVQSEDYLYCVTFPTNLEGVVPVFDERFGVVSRNESKGYLDFRTHRQIMFSDCAVYAANKWMEYGPNAAVAVGKNRYALNMVGLVTPKRKRDIAVGEELQRRLVRKGVTCTPWYDTHGPRWGTYQDHMDDDLLYTRFRISLGCTGKNTYTQRLLDVQRPSVRKAFSKHLAQNGFAFLLVKDGDFLDPSWPALPVLLIEATNASLLEHACNALLKGFDETAVMMLPDEADAIGEPHAVDDYGIAVLNVGTYANSIERGGTICMLLNHTCRWYGGTNNFPEGYLVPENRHHVYTYALYPHAGDWRQARAQHAGHEFNHPLMARQVRPAANPCLPPEKAFLKVEPANVILAAMKPWGNPIAAFERRAKADPTKGVMLRLYDTEGVASKAHIAFASRVVTAWSGNLLEERGEDLAVERDSLSVPLAPFSIETVGFVPRPMPAKYPRRALGPQREPVQPVWVRSWEHDAESMPMGYEPVVASISREVREEDGGRTLRLRVNVVNDYTDAAASGEARLYVPEGWRVEPERIAYVVEPLGYQPTEITVHRPTADAAGQIKLRFDHDGQTFQDVLEMGAAFDLDMSVKHEGQHIVVALRNPTAEAVESEVALASPIETWPQALVGTHALGPITPRTQAVALGPGEKTWLVFKVGPMAHEELVGEPSYWAVVKLMTNGRIHLQRCDWRPPARHLDDDRWSRRYAEHVKARKGHQRRGTTD